MTGATSAPNAIRDFTKAIELEEQYTEAYKARAYVYAVTNEFDKALADCDFMVKNFPQWGGAYETRSFVESAAEETEKAIDDLRKSIRLSEVNGDSREYLAFQNYQLTAALIRLGKQ
jgi:tetratricopeptide (TPR) repeat protein